MENYSKNTTYYIKLIAKWRFHFIIVTLTAMVVAFVFSSEFFIKPKYKSFAIVYPANITPYSTENPTEHTMQLLESADIRNSVVSKFNMINRYDIDTTKKGWKAALIKTYESNIECSKTEYQSILITATDTNAQAAADIVNEIINSLNTKTRELQVSKTKEVLVLAEWAINNKKQELDSLYSDLLELRVKYQILDYGVQVKEVVKGYVGAITGGKGAGGLKEMDLMMRNLEEKGGEYFQKWAFYNSSLAGYNAAIIDRENLIKELTKELTYTNIITEPVASDKKAYPLRWVILSSSVSSANLFLFLIILFIEFRKKTSSK